MNRLPPAPPYCSGTSMPINPSSKYLGSKAGSMRPAFSISITRGRTCSSANAATASRNMISSSERSVSAAAATASVCISLPDARLQCGWPHHGVSNLASPRRPELWHVAEWPVDAPLRRRMRIGADEESQELRSIQLAPDLRPAEEEALFRSKAIDDGLWVRGEGALHRRVRDSGPAEIAHVLAQAQLTLHVSGSVEHGVGIELCDDLVRLGLVPRCVLLAPPIAHIPEPVVLAALVVERVRHLVADDGAHRSIIQCVVCIRIVERWL